MDWLPKDKKVNRGGFYSFIDTRRRLAVIYYGDPEKLRLEAEYVATVSVDLVDELVAILKASAHAANT